MEITEIEGVFCNGIKEGKLGLGIVKCRGSVVGVFTKNKIKAAPVIVCREHISDGKIEGLIVNSGNANAFTGKEGIEDAREMCRIAAKLMGCYERDIAVASTGVIGKRLDMKWIKEKASIVFSEIGSSVKHAENFAKAITTTDRFLKKSHSKKPKISAVAKGAGMISPNMATMLCFIFTSASYDSGELYEMLKQAVDNSFNRLSVDGDMSTNDTVLLISTGREKVKKEEFQEKLNEVCLSIARQIAKDGEGATKLIEVYVTGAVDENDAIKAAKAVASSLLVKTAIFGNDPNWGRIIAALGYSGAEVDETISISLEGAGEVKLVEKGKPLNNESIARKVLENSNEIRLVINLHKGTGEGYALGCDLSYEYIKLNSEYTT